MICGVLKCFWYASVLCAVVGLCLVKIRYDMLRCVWMYCGKLGCVEVYAGEALGGKIKSLTPPSIHPPLPPLFPSLLPLSPPSPLLSSFAGSLILISYFFASEPRGHISKRNDTLEH